MTLTLAHLQPLLDQFKGDGLMVSCYADIAASAGSAPPWPGPFKARVTALKEMFHGDPRTRQQVERNLHAIGRFLESPEARTAQGMAVFSAPQRGFFKTFALDVPVANDLVVHPAPYLVPLLQAVYQQREYLVVLTDTHRGRLYAGSPGSVRLLEEVQEVVPSRQRSSGECWGTQQATIARHREDRILHYLTKLVECMEKTWAEHPFRGIVLLGEHEVLEHLRTQLPPRLAARVVYEGSHAWTDAPLAVSVAARATLTEVIEAEEKRRLEGLADRLIEGYRVAAGPGEVLDALQSGQVGPRGHGYLVLGPDPHEAVARCTACRTLYLDMPPTCPRCQAPCTDGNLWEEVLLQALRHDIVVDCVPNMRLLAQYGGMAAVLPKGQPAGGVLVGAGEQA